MDNLFEFARRHAEASPAKVAVSKWSPGHGFSEVTYADLVVRAERFAALLAPLTSERGFTPLLVAKSADGIACMLAAIALGRPFCFVNTKYRGPQIAAVLDAAESAVCVVDAAGLLALDQAWGDHPVLSRTRWLVVDGPAEKLSGRAEFAVLERMPAEAMEGLPVAAGCDEAAVGTCLFTSGSTGQPKGVRIGAADLMRRAAAEISWFGLSAADVLLSILPFSFDVGLNQLLTSLAVGAELVILDSWLPADILRACEARRVTGISAVPSIWQDMLDRGAAFDTGGRHAALRYVTVSGGSLSRTALERLPALVGKAGIFKTYGQTEAFRATSLRPEDYERKLDSVGRPFPGARVYVVRDDGSRCPAGEVGEVVHSGLGVMLGYLDDSEGSAKLRPNPFRGAEDPAATAVFTGDLGYLDEEGFLFLKGRRDRMVKVMGNRVYPQEVSNQLVTIPGVRDAVVTGVTQPDGQTRLVAFLTVTPGAGVSEGAVRRALGGKLPGFMVPKDFVFVGQMPRTATGKVDERRLVEGLTALPPRHQAAAAVPGSS